MGRMGPFLCRQVASFLLSSILFPQVDSYKLNTTRKLKLVGLHLKNQGSQKGSLFPKYRCCYLKCFQYTELEFENYGGILDRGLPRHMAWVK